MDDFIHEQRGTLHLLLRRQYAEALRPAMLEGLHCTPFDAPGGRGAVWTFPLAEAGDAGQALLRACRRGGVMRHLLRDSYLGANRPRREFEAHRYAEAMEVSAPLLLGVRWKVVAGCIYQQGALATKMLPEARTLDAVLLAESDKAPEQARKAGALVRRMHDRGVWHADLNVRNIVFAADDRPYLLDFDNARLTLVLPERARARNLLRLLRSMQKAGLHEAHFEALMDGYGALTLPAWLRRLYRWKWVLSDLF